MKVIIAGSRQFAAQHPYVYYVADAYTKSGFVASEIVSGTARGIDLAGEQFAQERKIPIKRFPANWERDGKAAGHIRNRQMADYADALIAIWDGSSRGTKGMIEYAKSKGLKVYVHLV